MTVPVFIAEDLSEKEVKVVLRSATQLAAEMAAAKITSEEVVQSFLKSAALAHARTNCVTEFLTDAAIARARELDLYFRENGTTVGPLHGVPVSVKEHIRVAGTHSTCGYKRWQDHRFETDALIVERLKRAGAIVICKTTDPQSLLAMETESNLYGRTTNPHNHLLSSGGSSGGEGALLASNGSALGVGTDIGGSIRTPAAFNGIYGLKPSTGRLPHSGLEGNHDGMENIIGCVGPLARSAEDLSLFCRAALADEPWLIEQSIPPMPWKTDVKVPEKLTVAIVWDDGLVKPLPPVLRALERTKSRLEAAGHQVITWDLVEPETAYKNTIQTYLLDGGDEYNSLLSTEDPAVDSVNWILNSFGVKRCSLEETWALNRERSRIQNSHNSKWNAAEKVPDVILCPANPSPATPHGQLRHWNYTSYWNYLDLPAVVFPVTTVSETDVSSTQFDYRSDIERGYHESYEPAIYKNAPVGLQLVGRRLHEEFLLGVLGEIEMLK
ncbi:unnamed protein product [Kuraishia capsulata CBS 1993]|uniref:amidase n=1 Tax=Kuraishia capsulata CBS 1993 TaxID=1382522 RepID=W6MUF9_9ASCO|nr:uncharacterized protein KUCA_T00005235001 [Kuraishia capsulata CBS 1993]CDK29247.1 unnamed protein product [Kuraishia capsulata CBS 1993]